MRKARSQNQANASRINGAKSRGPTSEVGKNKVRLNALKDGLFTKDIVIEAVGESKSHFERLKHAIWTELQPVGPLEEALVADFIENWWRRQRVRRAEATELKTRLFSTKVRDYFERNDAVEALRLKLVFGLERYRIALRTGSAEDTNKLINELDQVRQGLSSSVLGLNYLIEKLSGIEERAKGKGLLGIDLEYMLLACGGFGNQIVSFCIQLNALNRELAGDELREKAETTNDDDDAGSDEQREGVPMFLGFQARAIQEAVFGELLRKQTSGPVYPTTDKSERGRLRSVLVDMFLKEAVRERLFLRQVLNAAAAVESNLDEDDTDSLIFGVPQRVFDLEMQFLDEITQQMANAATQPAQKRADLLAKLIERVRQDVELRRNAMIEIEKREREQRYTAIISPTGNVADRFSRAETAIERRMYRALHHLLNMRREADTGFSLPLGAS